MAADRCHGDRGSGRRDVSLGRGGGAMVKSKRKWQWEPLLRIVEVLQADYGDVAVGFFIDHPSHQTHIVFCVSSCVVYSVHTKCVLLLTSGTHHQHPTTHSTLTALLVVDAQQIFLR